jgi:hypothetical protein
VFKSVPNRETVLQRDFKWISGEVVNLVGHLQMKIDIPEWPAKLNGTAIVCHMFEYFG